MEAIRLRSRYGVKNTLELLPDKGGKTYLFKTDMPSLRVCEPEKGKIEWIDPAGGPMICVGAVLDEVGLSVESIEFIESQGWTITFK